MARIKVSPSYTTAIGEALRIEGAEHVVDFAGLKPVLTLAQVAGHVQVKWVKQEMDALELWVDRGGGSGFALLNMATVSPYVDDAGLPGGMHSAMWQYKGIYIKSGARAGQWSDIVLVAVAG